jgi:tripartite-type tricarboxylate transporter receptor subunit TctC
MNRRHALVAALLATASLAAGAQEFPTRPVRIVTPFPAGAGPEAVLRVLAEKL